MPFQSDADTFQQYLVSRYVPSMYRDGNYPGLVMLLQFLSRFMDELNRDIISIPNLESVFDIPPFLLPFLAQLIGATPDATRSYNARLLEIRKTVNLYKIRGIPYSFCHVLKYAGASYCKVIKTVNNLIHLDINPMDSTYFMEGSTYNNPAIVDIVSNVSMAAVKPQLLDLVPAGTKAYFSYLIDTVTAITGITASAFVAQPQLWIGYGNSTGTIVGYKQVDTNQRVSQNPAGTIQVAGTIYQLNSSGPLVYLMGQLDYGEVPLTTFSHFYIYKNLVPATGYTTYRNLLPSQVSSPGTLVLTLTPFQAVVMDINQREIMQAILSFY